MKNVGIWMLVLCLVSLTAMGSSNVTMCPEGYAVIDSEMFATAIDGLRYRMTGHFSAGTIEFAVEEMTELSKYGEVYCWGRAQTNKLLSLLNLISPEPSISVAGAVLRNVKEMNEQDKLVNVNQVDRLDVLAPINTCDFYIFGRIWKAYNAAIVCEAAFFAGAFSPGLGNPQIYFGETNRHKFADCYVSQIEPDENLQNKCSEIEQLPVFYFCGSDYAWKYENLNNGVCLN